MPRRALLVPIAFGAFGVGLGRTLAVIAAELGRQGWAVEVLAKRDLDLDAVAERFGVRIGDARVRRWPAASSAGGAVGRAVSQWRRHRAFTQLSAGYDLLWMQTPYMPMRSRAGRSILWTEFPFAPSPSARHRRTRLGAYDHIVANSAFTRDWIARRWNVEAGVFFPAIHTATTDTDLADANERSILAVGRFAGGSRSKNQLALVHAFRQMVDEGLDDWTLTLAGLREDPGYLAQVEQAAQGYPIAVRPDLSFAALERAYARASIFWHGAGLGVDHETEPHSLEHFGIVTAEAMTAGCVPVAFGRGGPAEVVEEGTGFLWHDDEALRAHTWTLVRDPDRCRAMGRAARRSAIERFGDAAFRQRLAHLIDPPGSPPISKKVAS